MSPAAALVFWPGKPHSSHTASAYADPRADACVTQLAEPQAALSADAHAYMGI